MGPVGIMMLLAMMLAVGAFAGVIAGLLGVGGGIVLVPAMYYVFTALDFPPETRMHVAVATSLATIIVTSWRSVQSHHRKGAVDRDLLRLWGPWIGLGAALGAVLAAGLRTQALLAVFGVLAFGVALYMGFGRRDWRLADQPPGGAKGAGIGAATGVFSALMGIGGGTFGVPLLTLYGQAMHRAVGTAAGFGALIAVPSVIVFLVTGWGEARPPFTVGYVNLVAFAIIVPMTALCAPYGAGLAHRMNTQSLRLAFAVFLAFTALNMLRKAFHG